MNPIKLLVSITSLIWCFANAQNCASPVTRLEIRKMTPAQFKAFALAVNTLYSNGGANSVYKNMVSTHYSYVPRAHGVPAFFPWHREYLQRFQNALKQIDPSVIIPYWDWTIDAANPASSPVLNNTYYGGNGRSGDYCLTTGSFANWKAYVPSQHCLKRQYNKGSTMSSFYSAQSIEAILQGFNTNYDSFRQQIEGGPHGTVHVNIGGNNGDMTFMYSPNDPLFWAHHTFVDLLWNEWQQRYASLANTYNGKENNTNVSPFNILVPFGVPVNQVFNTKANGYCYTYPRWSAALPTSAQSSSRLVSRSLDNVLANIPDSLPESDTATSTAAQTLNSVNNLSNQAQASTTNIINAVSQIQEIQQPDPLPDSYIINNRLDVNVVRQQEQQHNQLTKRINNLVKQYRARHPRRG